MDSLKQTHFSHVFYTKPFHECFSREPRGYKKIYNNIYIAYRQYSVINRRIHKVCLHVLKGNISLCAIVGKKTQGRNAKSPTSYSKYIIQCVSFILHLWRELYVTVSFALCHELCFDFVNYDAERFKNDKCISTSKTT